MPLGFPLPDVALTDSPSAHGPLDWVGMQHIDVPLQLAEPGCLPSVASRASVQVDLPEPAIKGIHMSRLYRLLDTLASGPVKPRGLARLLAKMIESHADCHSRHARVQLDFNLLCRRPALVTVELSGWKCYPVQVLAQRQDGRLTIKAQVDVGYSSTCPCSAALSRQVVAQAFDQRFVDQESVARDDVMAWLLEHASAATPHSQRSTARIAFSLDPQADTLGLMALIERAEAALGTPLQTAVKRADEQAFAQLNGQHLMYVEDAARTLMRALQPQYPGVQVFVSHGESLHPHDAVAWAGPAQSGHGAFQPM
ncbi:GTP cyclohydrolase FolE2 [Pseudomonas sp. M47T1]|uniref:GTP cyclohydrolase FolE2 n=1 Tax=Pseudomonas sp. M47T1 TaxID=1179778 RepID=UPI000A313A06|nr:GTP cyclohydrolase FolE2 [Pseudomonas sp. M47T1]